MRERVRRSWREARYRRVVRRLAGPKIVRAFAGAYPEAFFVEIGANDGQRHDHLAAAIRSTQWRGIMVEPVPYVFERLKANYGDLDRVVAENSAIADRVGSLPFYYPAPAGEEERGQLPDWYDTIGSFSRETVLGHEPLIPDIEARLRRVEVATLTFDALLAKHGAEHVDLIVIDTEGYDWEIVRSIDITRHRPRLLVFEHYHLSPSQRADSRRHMEDLGYSVLEEGFDSFCLDTGIDDGLTAFWRRLRPGVPGVYAERDRAHTHEAL